MEALQINPLILSQMVTDLASQGWAQCRDLYPQEYLQQAKLRLMSLAQEQKLRPAQIGQRQVQKNTLIRSDEIHWIDSANKEDLFLLEGLEKVKKELSEQLRMALPQIEAQVAHYSPGSFYKTHWDKPLNDTKPGREITFVHYLNEAWSTGDEGQLVLLEPNEETVVTEINPTWGTSVFFISSRFPHFVRATRQSRFSLSGWYRSDRS